jgi:superfamily I DNA/RNA helicase/RecB family exonuclease
MLDSPVRKRAINLELARKPLQAISREPASALHDEVISARSDRSRFVSGVQGSGKTSTLILRALHLLEGSADSPAIDPSRLLVLTFSRTHADYLRDQIAIGAATIAREPIARTFASLAFSIVRMALQEDPREPILISGAEQDQMIRGFLASEFEVGNWPDDFAKALGTRGFAKELRDLISRAKEWGLSWIELEELAIEAKDENWIAAARFWRRMEEIGAIREFGVGDPKERIDPSELINRAALYLERSESLRTKVSQLFDHLLIDHFEESDPSHRRFLMAMEVKSFTIFHDIASVVSRFRGADPDGLPEFIDNYSSSRSDLLPAIDLETKLRSEPIALAAESESITEEARTIAEFLRTRHLRDGISWREMAVIVRSPGEHLSAIRRTLALSNVPVIQERGTQSLAESSAIRPLLMIAEIALGILPLTKENFEEVEQLLLSEFGGLDPLRLRRLREEINRTREEGDGRATDEVILSALQEGEVILSFDPEGQLEPLNQLLRIARKIARSPGSTITDLLWEIWSNAKDVEGNLISERWRDRAIESQSLYEVGAADRDLDLMIELFEVARRFVERFPQTNPALFIEELRATKIFGDVIAPSSDGGDRVTLTTVHSAKGQEWKVVVIAGVQEGIWPNLKSRGSLLGSERLVEIKRYGLLPRAELTALSANALAQDELRIFEFAQRRATEFLFVTAVSREDDLPSAYFFNFVAEHPAALEIDPYLSDLPLSPLPLIAHLRREVMDQELSMPERENAATLLKALSQEGFHGADASRWLGFNALSTEAPLIAAGEEIPVSPSEIDRFVECQLRWFLEKSGARDGDSQAALLGSAIHAYAQLIADGQVDLDEARARLEKTWHLIDRSTGWAHTHQLQSAIRILDRFFQWHSSNDRRVIATEARLNLQLGRVRLRGSADRVEIDDEGRLFIVDLKTSATPLTEKKTEENLQLAAYQTGLLNGGFDQLSEQLGEEPKIGGAELVYPASDAKSVSTRTQSAVDGERAEEIASIIEREAESMAGKSFIARINSNCRHCAVRTLCPMQGSGRSVVEG